MKKLNDATTHEWNTQPARETQIGGKHYKNSEHQPLEIVLHTEGFIAFRGACLCKIYKYLQRKKEGSDPIIEMEKAEHVTKWLLEETRKYYGD